MIATKAGASAPPTPTQYVAFGTHPLLLRQFLAYRPSVLLSILVFTDRRSEMRFITAIGTGVALAILVSGCGSDGGPDPEPTPANDSRASQEPSTPATRDSDPETDATSRPGEPGPVVEVDISGDRVDAPGGRVEATVGEPVTFVITSVMALTGIPQGCSSNFPTLGGCHCSGRRVPVAA